MTYPEYLLAQYRRYREEVDEVWVTIEYDFFSLTTEYMEDDECFTQPRVRIYHLSPEQISEEIAALIAFFEENGIPIARVVPSLPSARREYLNIPSGQDKRDFIAGVTAQILVAFAELSSRQNGASSPIAHSNALFVIKKGSNEKALPNDCTH